MSVSIILIEFQRTSNEIFSLSIQITVINTEFAVIILEEYTYFDNLDYKRTINYNHRMPGF